MYIQFYMSTLLDVTVKTPEPIPFYNEKGAHWRKSNVTIVGHIKRSLVKRTLSEIDYGKCDTGRKIMRQKMCHVTRWSLQCGEKSVDNTSSTKYKEILSGK